MTPLRQLLTAATVGAVVFATGVRLSLPTDRTISIPRCIPIARDADHDPTGRDISRLQAAEGTGPFDYSHGTWITESGDGRIIGYALTEDSPIYNTHNCAEWSN